jgi:hypothetical protein
MFIPSHDCLIAVTLAGGEPAQEDLLPTLASGPWRHDDPAKRDMGGTDT